MESFAIYRKICERFLDEDIVHFHSSALVINGKAILFAGSGGIGKSTHTRIWREKFGNKVTMIHDDEPLLYIGDTVIVYGTPFGVQHNLRPIQKPKYPQLSYCSSQQKIKYIRYQRSRLSQFC